MQHFPSKPNKCRNREEKSYYCQPDHYCCIGTGSDFKNLDKNPHVPRTGTSYHGELVYHSFTENPGIAFGLQFGGRIGKIFLTLFRLAAVFLIGYYLIKIIKKEMAVGFCVSMALIFIGAIGNIVDSLFYGLIFKYDGLFHGRVVDMLYFPVINTHYPSWFPLWGGQEFIFFRPVFNLSDTAITIGVFSILIFYNKVLKKL